MASEKCGINKTMMKNKNHLSAITIAEIAYQFKLYLVIVSALASPYDGHIMTAYHAKKKFNYLCGKMASRETIVTFTFTQVTKISNTF